MGPQQRFKPQLDSLDDRALMSVALAPLAPVTPPTHLFAGLTSAGVLRVTGTASEEIRVTMPTPNQLSVQNVVTGERQTFNASEITSVLIRPRGVDNQVVFATKLTMPAEVRVWTGYSTIVSSSANNIVVAGTGNALLVSEAGTATHNGTGKTNFHSTNAAYQPARIFEVNVEKLPPNALAVVYLDGVAVGRMRLDAQGRGSLRYDSTLGNFPANFPEIRYGSVLTIQINGLTVARTYPNPWI